MRYEISGGTFPVVTCGLANGEQMITEGGSMVWMTPNMQMETRAGGIGGMFSKAFSGENLFQNIYTARGEGSITFGSSFPGQILAMNIQPGQDLILQKARSSPRKWASNCRSISAKDSARACSAAKDSSCSG